jgi:phosphatidylserine/phosphatidylglycerophosphate/cardiolipin synthase-like enzyme
MTTVDCDTLGEPLPAALAPYRSPNPDERLIARVVLYRGEMVPVELPPAAVALVDAHKRGVRVEVLLDKSQRTEKYSAADFLAHAGILTRIDAQHKIAHNKVMVIDGAVVITGSFNFTKGAEYDNAKNLLVIRSKELAAQYTRNWEAHAAHADPYEGRR